jgi:hypothetical protein
MADPLSIFQSVYGFTPDPNAGSGQAAVWQGMQGGGGGRDQLAQLMPQQQQQQQQQQMQMPQMGGGGGGLTAYGSPEYAEWERQMTAQQQMMQSYRENPQLWLQQYYGSGPGNSGVAGPGGAPGSGFGPSQGPGNPSQGPNPGNPSQGPNPGNPNGVFGDPANISSQATVANAIANNAQIGAVPGGFFGIAAPNVQNNFSPTVDNPYGIMNAPNMENPFSGYMNSMNMMGYTPGFDAGGNGGGGGIGGPGGLGGGGSGGGYGFGIGPGPGGENSVGPDGGASPY